jgi:hypothetical protein
MINVLIFVYMALLFFVLSPGILVTLPPKANKYKVAAVHGLIFTLIGAFTHIAVERLGGKVTEGNL